MDWCWGWNSNTLATSCEELTHWKRPWCWEGLGAGGEGDERGWDGWIASPTRRTWVWVNSASWWWTGRPDVLQFMGSQRVGHDWATKLSWSSLNSPLVTPKVLYAFCLSFQNISSNISYLKWHLKQFLPKISLKVQVKSKHSHNVWPWRSLRSYHF